MSRDKHDMSSWNKMVIVIFGNIRTNKKNIYISYSLINFLSQSRCDQNYEIPFGRWCFSLTEVWHVFF